VPDALIALFSQFGPWGAAVALLAWYIIRREGEHKTEMAALRTELSSVQEKRVGDAQSVTVKLLEITEKWHNVMDDLTVSLRGQREVLDKINDSINDRRAP